MNYVIIGNSVAGIANIEAIREYDKTGKITVISDESYINYSRPLISYFLANKVSIKNIHYRNKDFYTDNNVELLLNTKAQKLDIKNKKVVLENNKKISYDKLLISTGGKPIIPDIKGVNLKGVFTFIKLSEAEKLQKYIKDNRIKSAVIIGGGLIGLKVTEALIDLKIKTTIIELANRIMAATFNKKASSIIEGALGKIGCKLWTNTTISEIKSEKGKISGIKLANGEKISTKLLILAIGVRPNIELIKNTPIAVNRGIIVDSSMQTNVPDIYAAGDCCEANDLLSSTNRVIAIWPNAYRQGKIAGYNMTGKKQEQYEGSIAMNSVELAGIPTISAGTPESKDKDSEELEFFDAKQSIYKKFILKDNKIIGFIFVNAIDRAGIYTNLLKEKTDVSSFKEHLLKDDFGIINLPKEYRKHMVTGTEVEIGI